jgi:hypothetical protein
MSTTDIVLSMAHVALNDATSAVEVNLGLVRQTRLLKRLSQIVLAVSNDQAVDAVQQLAVLELDMTARKPDPQEVQVLAIVRAMFDAATGPGPELRHLPLVWMSRLFTSVSYGGFKEARYALEQVLKLMPEARSE